MIVDHLHDRVDERVAEVVGLEPEVDEFLVFGVVVVAFLFDARVLEVLYLGSDAVSSSGVFDELGQLEHVELLGELIEHTKLAAVGGIEEGQLNTG